MLLINNELNFKIPLYITGTNMIIPIINMSTIMNNINTTNDEYDIISLYAFVNITDIIIIVSNIIIIYNIYKHIYNII